MSSFIDRTGVLAKESPDDFDCTLCGTAVPHGGRYYTRDGKRYCSKYCAEVVTEEEILQMDVNDKLRVSQLPGGEAFVVDSQDVRAVIDYLVDYDEDYNSFFVQAREGDYVYVFGCYRIAPGDDVLLWKVA